MLIKAISGIFYHLKSLIILTAIYSNSTTKTPSKLVLLSDCSPLYLLLGALIPSALRGQHQNTASSVYPGMHLTFHEQVSNT